VLSRAEREELHGESAQASGVHQPGECRAKRDCPLKGRLWASPDPFNLVIKARPREKRRLVGGGDKGEPRSGSGGPKGGQVHVGGQVAPPWVTQQIVGRSVRLVSEGCPRRTAGCITKVNPLASVINHNYKTTADLICEFERPLICNETGLCALPFCQWRAKPRAHARRLCLSKWHLHPNECVLFVQSNTTLCSAVRGRCATDINVKGERIEILVRHNNAGNRRRILLHDFQRLAQRTRRYSTLKFFTPVWIDFNRLNL
jgi:hypothetical protein